ncbi:Rib/alpha-like domain-containing protein, partial [Finegoldia magna]|uniref:Rib/alpha-like domain-containing protein n=1 Tax=Finegoldia magna TaxID=1260 RepID=UPI000798E57F
MNNKKIFEKIITEKRAKCSNERPKYGLRKLTVGVVSCLLGYMMFMTPNVVVADKADAPQAVEATVKSTEDKNVEVKKKAEQPNKEVVKPEKEEETTAEKSGSDKKSGSEVAYEKANTSKSPTGDTQDRSIKTTETDKSTEFKLTDEQKKKLVEAGLTDGEIEFVTNEIKSELATDKNFNVDEYLTKVIKLKKEGKNIGAESTSIKNEISISDRGPEDSNQQAQPASEEFVEEKAKENWDKKPQDKSRWAVGEKQRLVRVSTSDPVEMNDVDYDGTFVDANGRTVIRLLYKEKSAAATGVWYRALFNFGELDQYIDYDSSYVVGVNVVFGVASEQSDKKLLTPFNDRKERMFDLGKSRGDGTNTRKNLPINLVLKKGVTLKDLEGKNYTVQMRVTDAKGEKIYAYAPGKSSMDYSTYTKTTSVSLDDKVNSLFLKGGYQKDSENATNQESFMSEFIANPKQYKDSKQIGIIRTQYFGQRSGNAVSPTVGGEPIAFTQAFDSNLVQYLKEDEKGNIAYVNVLNNTRELSKYTHNFGIKRKDLNYSPDGKLAYFVIAPNAFQKDRVNKVEVEKHDQFTMLSGFYFTSIDYLVDKSKFENTFDESKTRKLDYSMISGWTNPNKDGWAVFEKSYDNGYVAQEGDSYLVDTTSVPTGGQIMIKIGDGDQAIIRKGQGYYNAYVTNKNSIESITEYAKGVFEFKLREGATIRPGDKLKIYMPYTKEHKDPVNFLEINNATKRNEGAATLTLNKDRNITMHFYKEGKKGHYVLKYTLADGKESSMKFTPKGFWNYSDTDRILTGTPNTATLDTGGNFYLNTKKLKPGADIIVESYDENGQKIENQTSYFRYDALQKGENYTNMTWVDHTDTSSILSINKSLYKPYQVIFTNDYAEGTDDFYKDPKVLPSDNKAFMKDTDKIQGYTKYDGGSIRMRTELKDDIALLGKTHALADEYTDKGEIKVDNSSKLILKGADGEKEYRVYRYDIDLNKLGEISKAGTSARDVSAEGNNKLVLKKDMKLYFNASDGSSLPTEIVESRVRTRVLFDTTDGKFADASTKSVRIAPDNVKYADDQGYVANGFTGANVAEKTGDSFAENPTAEGKTFLGWVTEAGKTALGKTITTAEAFNKLSADQKFTETTPITTHQVVYAIWSEEKLVTFDANGGKFDDDTVSKAQKTNEDKTVTEPKAPTQEGKEFLGWASTKDATAPEDGILQNVEDNKTVYAVWKDAETEKTAEKVQPAYTEADAEAGKATTITAPNFTDKDGKETTKPEGAKFALGEGAPEGATINPDTGEIKYTPAEADAGKDVQIPVVVTYKDGSTDKVDAKVTVKDTTPDTKAPAAPTVTANDDGSVTVTPPTDE